MYINNDELDILIKIEHLIFMNKDILFQDDKPQLFADEEITVDDIYTYWNIIDRLLKKKEVRNERQAKINRKKRKIDPMYGRSKKEKERRK